MSDELISTTLFDDPDPEGTDKYGMLPLIMEMLDEEPDEEDRRDHSDGSGADKRGGGGESGNQGEGSDEPLIEPSSLEIELPEGEELPDEDDAAYLQLTERGADDLSPGEAENLINYMRPMSEEEQAFYDESPLNRDIERVDDPAHTSDVLKAGKSDNGVDNYLQDASYGDDMRDPDETAELGDSDESHGWIPRDPRFTYRYQDGYNRGQRSDGRSYPQGSNARGYQQDGGRRRRRHHKHRRGGQLQPGQPGYGLQPGQPGYGLQPGQQGYTIQPGQPGYVAPSPGQPGYVDSSYAAAHASTTPAATTALTTQQYYPGTTIPVPQQYYPGTTTPVQQQYYPGTTTPYQTALPYGTASTPTTQDSESNTNYIMGRDRAKVSMVRGLGHKLTVEHANWLADQDMASGHPVRPRSYYENVGKLWAADRLKRARIPLSTTMGNWSSKHRDFVTTADGVLAETAGARKRFSVALGVDVDMGGWSPFGAIKSAVKSVAKYTVEKPLQYGYKYGKMAVTKPLTYTYKGVKYVGKMAEKLALAPIRAIINRFTKTMVSRRANALAKQKGLSAPTAVEKASAKNWAKSLVRAKGGKYGGAIASLMGSEYGIMPVDISLGGNDLMGVGTAGVAGLILLGPVGLLALLTGLVKLSSPAAPAPDPGSAEAAAEASQAAQDAASQDQGAADDGSYDASADSSYDASANSSYDASADSSYDQSGSLQALLSSRARKTVSIEQINHMPKNQRKIVQQLIQSGRVRLA